MNFMRRVSETLNVVSRQLRILRILRKTMNKRQLCTRLADRVCVYDSSSCDACGFAIVAGRDYSKSIIDSVSCTFFIVSQLLRLALPELAFSFHSHS